MEDASPRIWVDADACPVAIREIVVRAAERARVPATFVANQWLRLNGPAWVRAMQVPATPDAADSAIVEAVRAGDLVITQDIPLAALVLGKGAIAIDPRGQPYSADSIGERLSMRSFMDELRGAGVQTGGAAPFHARDRQAFANRLDRWIATRGR